VRVETSFAELKGPLGLARATLRGTNKVQIKALLAYAVHNIKQLVKVMRNGRLSGVAKKMFPDFSFGFNSLALVF